MPTWRGARGHRERSQEDLDLGLQKKLVWLLRHQAGKFNLHVDPAGFASVHDILALGEFETWKDWKLADVSRVVDNCGKGRLELQGTTVRAVQGHTMRAVTSAAERWEPDQEVLMHGTTLDKWPCIRREGLHRLARNHVHLSADFGEHLRDSEILVTVNVEACLAQGLLFEQSRNGVILTTGPIPPTCFQCVEWSVSGRSSRSSRSTAVPGVPSVTLWAADQDRTHEACWEGRDGGCVGGQRAQPAAQPPTFQHCQALQGSHEFRAAWRRLHADPVIEPGQRVSRKQVQRPSRKRSWAASSDSSPLLKCLQRRLKALTEGAEEEAEVSEDVAEKEEEAEATEEEADKQEVPEVPALAAHQVVVVSDSEEEEAEDRLLPQPRVPLPEPLAAYLQPVAPATRPGQPRPSKRYRLLSPQPQR